MFVCPLHFYDKEKLYGHVPTTSEAETKSYILAQLTRRLLCQKDTHHHNRNENSILIYRLSFCLFVIDVDIGRYKYIPAMLSEVHSNSVCTYLTYHAAAVERSQIVMDNGDAAAAGLLPCTCTFAQEGKRIHCIPKVGSDLHVHVHLSAMSVRGRREVDTCTTRSRGKEDGEKKIKRWTWMLVHICGVRVELFLSFGH